MSNTLIYIKPSHNNIYFRTTTQGWFIRLFSNQLYIRLNWDTQGWWRLKRAYPVQHTIWDSLLQIRAFSLSKADVYSTEPRGNSFQRRRSFWKLGQLVIGWHFTPDLQVRVHFQRNGKEKILSGDFPAETDCLWWLCFGWDSGIGIVWRRSFLGFTLWDLNKRNSKLDQFHRHLSGTWRSPTTDFGGTSAANFCLQSCQCLRKSRLNTCPKKIRDDRL